MIIICIMKHSQPPSTCRATSTIALDSLSEGAQLFIQGVRRWAEAARQRQCVKRALIPGYASFGCTDAIDALDELMSVIAVSAYRPVHVCAPDAVKLSEDEYTLLTSIRALQRRQETLAREALSKIIAGGLNRTFRRVARAYLDITQAAGLDTTGLRKLTLVES